MRKLGTFVLVLALVLAMFPMTALAAGEYIGYKADGTKVDDTLENLLVAGDVTVILINGNVTINSTTDVSSKILLVNSGVTVTIAGGTVTMGYAAMLGTGKVEIVGSTPVLKLGGADYVNGGGKFQLGAGTAMTLTSIDATGANALAAVSDPTAGTAIVAQATNITNALNQAHNCPIGSGIALSGNGTVTLSGKHGAMMNDAFSVGSDVNLIIASGAELSARHGGDIDNSGTITFTDSTSSIYIQSDIAGKTATFDNTGTITGNGDINIGGGGAAGNAGFTNSGTILGTPDITVAANGALDSRYGYIDPNATVDAQGGAYTPPSSYYAGYYGGFQGTTGPSMSPSTTAYTGGNLVFSTSGMFGQFQSFSVNGMALTNGTDYIVENIGGYARITVYESALRSLSGSARFTAAFSNGSASATVNMGAYIPDEIELDPPKTGDAGNLLGLVFVLLALALAAVARRARA